MKNHGAALALIITFAAAIIAISAITTFARAPVNTASVQTKGQANRGAEVNSNSNPFVQAANSPDPVEAKPSELLETFQIVTRLFLAVLLSGILAFRPDRKNVPLFRRSLFVSQTQILLAVVAAALMLIVGDNTARAFAIFAAVSLVRFRTNIRDPKEITVLLISLALGLAAGVGRWDLGIALCLFALGLLWLLEFREHDQTFRSMELTVRTRSPDKTQEILKKIFLRQHIDAEVREIVPVDEDKAIGSITYYLNLRINLTTDALSDRILSADPDNTEGIQWSKSKSASDIYQ